MITIAPQPGKQYDFVSCKADIAIYGGAAGGGKSYALLLEAMRLTQDPHHRAVLFRKNATMLSGGGGLVDESNELYPLAGGVFKQNPPKWTFPSGATIQMGHMAHKDTHLNWKGLQFTFAGFDELTDFSEESFFYMLSRLRCAKSDIKPYLRATTNPAPNWVAKLIEWWIDDDGYPIEARSGKIRYLVRFGGENFMFASKKKAKEMFPKIEPNAFTFINAKLTDNKVLMRADPKYGSNLQALSSVDSARLLEGNWLVANTGYIFNNNWWKYYKHDDIPEFEYRMIFADTAMKTGQQHDYTVFQHWGKVGGKIYLLDQLRGKWGSVRLLQQAKIFWGKCKGSHSGVLRKMAIEDKASGIGLNQQLKDANIPIMPIKRGTKDKEARANDVAAYIEAGNVYLPFNAEFLQEFNAEFSSFPLGEHDDQIDPLMDAIYQMLIQSKKTVSIRSFG